MRKHNEKVCSAQDLGSNVQGQGRNQVRGQNLSTKTTEANLAKLHRKIEHNEVCRAQELGSYTRGQGHNQVRSQIAPKLRSE